MKRKSWKQFHKKYGKIKKKNVHTYNTQNTKTPKPKSALNPLKRRDSK